MAEFDLDTLKPYLPTAPRVAVTFLRNLVPLLAPGIATTLPKIEAFHDGMFVTVNDLPGGAAEIDLPQLRHTVVTISTWGAFPNSDVPQWNRAAIVAELLWDALSGPQPWGGVIDLGLNYRAARVQAMFAISEPRKVEDDPSAYARYTFDAQIDWAALHAPYLEL